MNQKEYKPAILLVDDEQAVLDGLKRSLRHEDMEIYTANSGEAALELCASLRIAVLVSDEMMPGMSGTALISEVCARFPDTMRLMLTGHATMEAAIKAINEGEVYRFLQKPVNSMELAIAVRQALVHRSMLYDMRVMSGLIRQQAAMIDGFAEQAKNFAENLGDLNPVKNPIRATFGKDEQTETHVLDITKYLTPDDIERHSA